MSEVVEMAKEVVVSVYPCTGDIEPVIDEINECVKKLRKTLKEKTGIDFKIEVSYEVITDERCVEVEPDVIDDEVAEKINGLTVKCGEIEMEVTAEFSPDYVPLSLR